MGDDEDDDDEPEQPAKKEGQSIKDFVSKRKEISRERGLMWIAAQVQKKEEPKLSKKEQKQKELEDLDKILNEFKCKRKNDGWNTN